MFSKRRRDDSDEEDYVNKLAEELDEDEYVPVKQRRAQQAAQARARRGEPDGAQDRADASASAAAAAAADADVAPSRAHESLLKTNAEAQKSRPQRTEAEKLAEEETALMASLMKKQALRSVKENAVGIQYSDPIRTGWNPPRWLLRRSEDEHQRIRDKLHIDCAGEDILPPIPSFRAMKLPRAVRRCLAADGIKTPTPVQAQALPVILSGRDCVGISYTGSGKTLAFALPLILLALQEEWRMPLQEGEGPYGLIICPSRELARQTHEIMVKHIRALQEDGWPEIRPLLCVGGEDVRAAGDTIRRGFHAAVCTPGRLKDFLAKRRFTLDICRYLCLDEADRMVDTGFEEDLREIMSFFTARRQTVMFSATMPDKIRAFAASALTNPITVNVSRAGAANLDVKQEVQYVKTEDKLSAVLACLRKTAPPVLVFAERTRDVDMVHEYLLTNGVDAVAIHGGKDQQERVASIVKFKESRADVLCATDVAGKGLDFDGIQHVINYDMPEEIENYVHRIGRTGRRGRTGLATTFVNLKENDDTILLDLKYLLKEAKQEIPAVLQAIEDPMDKYAALEAQAGTKGCAYCGGLGHRMQNCPKLRAESRQAQLKHRPSGPERAFGGEM